MPFRLVVKSIRVLSALFLLAMVLLLIPLGLNYVENASSYAWVRYIQQVDDAVVGSLKSVAPTKIAGYDLARGILLVIAYAISRILEGVSVMLAKKFNERDLKKRYDAFKKAGMTDRQLANVKKKMDSLNPNDAKSREELVRLMVETKKKLDSLTRELAFLAIDVVGSTKLKVGEEQAYVDHDFKEYKKLVEAAMDRENALKSAWTPDGVMICFGSIEEAIRAAQSVLLDLARFNAEVKAVKTQFRVRCGINAGPVHYEKSQRMEEMSDRVIDVAGHMQKYAKPDVIYIPREVLERSKAHDGFKPANAQVDGYECYEWKAPSADPTATVLRGKVVIDGLVTDPHQRAQALADAGMSPEPAKTSVSHLNTLSDLSTPGTHGSSVRATASIAEKMGGSHGTHSGVIMASDKTMLRPPPDQLGKYELKREIGRGAMGVVYEAWDPMIERRVAIKTIRQDQLDSSEAEEILARFQREAKAAGKLSHPNIVAVYEFGQEAGMYYIAMEFMDGRELKDFFDKHERFPLTEVVRLMGQLLEALDLAGSKGIVHRDIKPANLFICPDGTLKVADFGIARIESSQLTQTGAAIGTPTYMSPEQLLGQPVDGRSDLFSAGVVLYQFLTGEKPFTGERATTVITKVLSENPAPPSSLDLTLPASFDAPTRKALAKKPDDRFQSGKEFAEALRTAYQNRDASDKEIRESEAKSTHS
jgi:class 3 adenylate cyclase/tRNA A-37 threonylcarbamoyl transferase component Bud32